MFSGCLAGFPNIRVAGQRSSRVRTEPATRRLASDFEDYPSLVTKRLLIGTRIATSGTLTFHGRIPEVQLLTPPSPLRRSDEGTIVARLMPE